MKKKILHQFATLTFAVASLAACSHDNNAADGTIDVTDKVQFSFSAEPFNADEELSRAVPQPQTIDLGNGLEAEVSTELDTPEPETRAIPIYDGTYSIIALNSDGTRAGKITGTVSSGKFTRDVNQSLRLAPGTYTFVCFNSAVTDEGANLIYNEHNLQPAPKDQPLIGRTTATISGTDYYVPFTMKRYVSRVRFRIVTYTADAVGVTVKLSSSHKHHRSHGYKLSDASINQFDRGDYSQSVETLTYPVSGETFSSIKKPFISTTPYLHFLGAPTGLYGFIGSDYAIQFTGGTVHGKSLPTTKYYLQPKFKMPSGALRANSSYTLTVKFKSKDPLLLFQDGTVGYYGDRTTARQPVAVVIDEKTASSDGLAVALKNGNQGIYTNDITTQTNPLMSTDFNTLHADMDGYRYTYEASGNADGSGKSKAEVAVNGGKYNAFYQAVHFNAGAPISFSGGKTGKWFLPSMGQWKHMLDKILAPNNPPTNFGGYGYWYAPGVGTYFINVGGDYLIGVWLSSEYSLQNATYYMTYDAPIGDHQHYLYLPSSKTESNPRVRPFIYF
ncbi:hypothetical protein HMPREF9151_00415 [Hoylesella saccharolytica F0055]|uniref:Lipoprotein n=1 Tax=Hoylesella saccharolytica F0055 TaxID=1127699 RepID=L1NIC5_9BACT|nr:hypothetical protein [Hoylesella saccharolytica]EKY03259.1 hypothetical protein HMPREF9151_00415 [Hoylesella saccharolytica F0055]